MSYQVRSVQVGLGQIRSGQVRSGLVKSGQVWSCQFRSGQVRSRCLDEVSALLLFAYFCFYEGQLLRPLVLFLNVLIVGKTKLTSCKTVTKIKVIFKNTYLTNVRLHPTRYLLSADP